MTGAHENGKTNDDVIIFWSYGPVFNFFPQNIIKIFKNTQKILLQSANLASVTKYDLQPFGNKLTHLWIGANNIEVIVSDLFEFTPNLELVQISSLKIKYVGSGAFDNLKKLTILNAGANPCHSGYASDRASVVALIANFESKCQDLQALERLRKINPTTTEAPTTTTTIRNLAEEVRNELNAEIAKSKAENEKLQLEVEKLRQENEKCTKIDVEVKFMEMNENLLRKFKDLENKLEAKFDSSDAKIKSYFDTKFSSTEDACNEQFSSINATCTLVDYKMDILSKECVSRAFFRQP